MGSRSAAAVSHPPQSITERTPGYVRAGFVRWYQGDRHPFMYTASREGALPLGMCLPGLESRRGPLKYLIMVREGRCLPTDITNSRYVYEVSPPCAPTQLRQESTQSRGRYCARMTFSWCGSSCYWSPMSRLRFLPIQAISKAGLCLPPSSTAALAGRVLPSSVKWGKMQNGAT